MKCQRTTPVAAMCRAHGIEVEYLEIPGADHFDMTGAMGDIDQPLLPAILRQMGLDPGPG